jgi:hypothetical protein
MAVHELLRKHVLVVGWWYNDFVEILIYML